MYVISLFTQINLCIFVFCKIFIQFVIFLYHNRKFKIIRQKLNLDILSKNTSGLLKKISSKFSRFFQVRKTSFFSLFLV